MKYMLLIYEHEPTWLAMTAEEHNVIYAGYRALMGSLQERGAFHHGAQLEPTTTATTVRVRNGSVEATDGPFAETREQLGGYILVEAANLDEAIAMAARIPTARNGSIEVRPLAPPSVPPPPTSTDRATARSSASA